jgi:hypothetical protein
MASGDYIRSTEAFSSIDQTMLRLQADAQRRSNPAGYMHERMMQFILAHQRALDPEKEIGIHVVGGAVPPFHLRSMRFSNPDILIFIGQDADGNTVQLMQHHSQMGVMLVAVPKLEEKAFRIGFLPEQERKGGT